MEDIEQDKQKMAAFFAVVEIGSIPSPTILGQPWSQPPFPPYQFLAGKGFAHNSFKWSGGIEPEKQDLQLARTFYLFLLHEGG